MASKLVDLDKLEIEFNAIRRKLIADGSSTSKTAFDDAFIKLTREHPHLDDWSEIRREIGIRQNNRRWRKRAKSVACTEVEAGRVDEKPLADPSGQTLPPCIAGMTTVGGRKYLFVATWTSEDSLVITIDRMTVVILSKVVDKIILKSVGSLVPGAEPIHGAEKVAKIIAADLASERISRQKRLF